MDNLPDHVTIYMTEFLSGYDICVLSHVNRTFREFCSNYEKILKLDERVQLLDPEDMYEYYEDNNFKPFNAIIRVKPVCSERYLKYKLPSLFKIKDINDEDIDEISDEEVENIDDDGFTRISNDHFCKGTVFVDPNDGKPWCENCMTHCYDEEWKSWEQPPRIAKNTKFYVQVKKIERIKNIITETHTEYAWHPAYVGGNQGTPMVNYATLLGTTVNSITNMPPSRTRTTTEYETEVLVGDSIIMDNGIMFAPSDEYDQQPKLILDKCEYFYDSVEILVSK